MKPAAFDYVAPATLDEALDALAAYGDGAEFIAGGQSLGPLLNFRLSAPEVLIDLNGVGSLDGITETNGSVTIGAMTRQSEAERSQVVARRLPLVAQALPFVGHRTIRNRGTIGGSIAHADPSAELPAVAVALDADLNVVGARRRGLFGGRVSRMVKASEFFVTAFATTLASDEILASVSFPAAGPRAGFSWVEIARRHGDFALVSAAACLELAEDGTCAIARLAYAGVGAVPKVAEEAAAGLVGQAGEAAFARAADTASREIDPGSDVQASADLRRHLVGVLTRRALRTAHGNVTEPRDG